MKKTFLQMEKPLLCAMIQCATPQECIIKIKASLEDGAEAIGVQLCKLSKEYRTKECLTQIFEACEDKPIYITSYRGGESEGMSDEECMELLLLGLESGATICDVMGDTFDKGAALQLTEKEDAVARQKELIAEIHKRGGEVLMSCHTGAKLSAKETLRIAKAQEERGADVIKIVNDTDSIEDLPESIASINLLQKEATQPFLFLVGGPCHKLIRHIGPNLGVCMYLCVQYHGPMDTKAQPVLRHLREVREHLGLGNA